MIVLPFITAEMLLDRGLTLLRGFSDSLSGQPPRLAYIESGPLTLAGRVHPRLASWLAALVGKLGLTRLESFRIPWSKVLDVGIDIDVDVDAEHTPAFAVEHWLRQHIIGRIPGA